MKGDITNPLVDTVSLLNSYGSSLQYDTGPEIGDIINNAVCEHQKQLTELIFETINIVDEIRSIRSINKLKEKIKNLFFIFFFDKRAEACKLSEKSLNRYFMLDRNRVPRIIIKGLRKSDNHIIDYYRSCGDPLSDSYSFHLNENTAFSSVSADTKSYCSNNIPLELIQGTYQNNRVIPDKIMRYSYNDIDISSRFLSYDEYIFMFRDPEWERCWKPYPVSGNHVSPKSCYKSTLVIPIALSHINSLTKRRLGISTGFNSALFGYLCFDDIGTNYFNLPLDQNIGYILADFLSFYFLIMYYFEHKVLSKEIAHLNRKIPEWKIDGN